jgi:hypothetical protein
MSSFVRKNLLVATATFTAADGSETQPASATLVLNFNSMSGVAQTVSVPLGFNAGDDDVLGTWTGTWDSSAAQQGNVSWMIYGDGSLQAAAQGQFQIVANSANTV